MGDEFGDYVSEFVNSTMTSLINDTLVENGPVVGATDPATLGYCGSGLKAFGDGYRGIHGYTSLVVCLFGCFANILNLIVLTRKEMINPTNAILTGLALADLLNMIEYMPYAVYMNYLTHRKTYGWALFVLTHSNFSQVCHTISIWLTVTLAVWRYIMVAMPLKSKTLCTMERSNKSGTPATTSAPVNATSTAAGQNGGAAEDKYIVNLSDLANDNPFLMTTNFWLYSVVIKIIPCIMLTVVSLRLINSLMEAKKRKDKLLAKRTGAANPAARNNNGVGGGHEPREQESGGSDRTTRMLLAVLLLFLITEFPQGLLGLLSGLLGDSFFKNCYIPLADLMDFFALLNSAINFILYCVMSKKFRETFVQVFHLNRLLKLRKQHRGANHHLISSPTTTRQLLSSSDAKEQTAV
ncbi:Sex peptide receptor [Orchesella cincta]|uniref:Sex peptide receptor n=1 Tax=Orchesella cincta TaxID=48709 RepID=A0A1D2NFS7_ORCCI|nr:Sex peptide receptor [Orchesella cincta]